MNAFTCHCENEEAWIYRDGVRLAQACTQADAEALLPLLQAGQTLATASCYPTEPDGWVWVLFGADNLVIAQVTNTDDAERLLALLWRDPE